MTVANKKVELPHLTSVDRIFKIPLVDSGYHIVTILYGKVKVSLTEGGPTRLSDWFCQSLTPRRFDGSEIVWSKKLQTREDLPPTKDYVQRNVFQPMIKRAESDSSNAKKTITHIKKFRHKLQKRLTQRAIIEAKALKRQGADTLQAIMYMADLIKKEGYTELKKRKSGRGTYASPD
ncbi:uncharacterized protein LOC103519425 [Diaphorina citri]|uniref:Uncharacterized protein LOC103519425 n=1 Tax=Diaphorina citri TaxID=121845 RepID=A0A1S3DK96_DIACI|nr:uncharacterized protein LOC103519425 [Diaphorina citri]